jgi:uncharacterized membrane-anchored protein
VIASLVLALILATSTVPAQQQDTAESDVRKALALPWQKGPSEGRIAEIAAIKISNGLMFLDSGGTRRFLELTGNPPRDGRYTLAARDLSWFAIFFFDESGYVKDDEKLDSGSLLTSLKADDAPSNKERARLGMPALYTDGWHVPPHYDVTTRRLEWGIRLRTDEGHMVVNYAIRLLGRRGVMHAILVSDPASLESDVTVFKAALGGYEFVRGERYAEFRAGDRVAEYGLAALVLGGAAAAATKTGFGKALIKLLIAAGVAVLAGIGAVWRRLTGRTSDSTQQGANSA